MQEPTQAELVNAYLVLTHAFWHNPDHTWSDSADLILAAREEVAKGLSVYHRIIALEVACREDENRTERLRAKLDGDDIRREKTFAEKMLQLDRQAAADYAQFSSKYLAN